MTCLACLPYLASMSDRKQINIRVDDDFVEAVGELQRLLPGPRPPSMADAIREAVMNELARRRRKPARA